MELKRAMAIYDQMARNEMDLFVKMLAFDETPAPEWPRFVQPFDLALVACRHSYFQDIDQAELDEFDGLTTGQVFDAFRLYFTTMAESLQSTIMAILESAQAGMSIEEYMHGMPPELMADHAHVAIITGAFRIAGTLPSSGSTH